MGLVLSILASHQLLSTIPWNILWFQGLIQWMRLFKAEVRHSFTGWALRGSCPCQLGLLLGNSDCSGWTGLCKAAPAEGNKVYQGGRESRLGWVVSSIWYHLGLLMLQSELQLEAHTWVQSTSSWLVLLIDEDKSASWDLPLAKQSW